MSQRVAVVLDPMGTFKMEPEEERDEILKELRTRVGLDPVLVHFGNDPRGLPETQIDLLVIDYGAIWQQRELTADWTRGLLTWAEDHPNSMVLIWSAFTADMFVDELRDRFESSGGSHGYGAPGQVDSDGKWVPPWPFNVRAWYPGDKWSASWEAPDSGLEGDDDWGRWYHQSREVLRSWFGVKGETPDEVEVEEILAKGPLVAPAPEVETVEHPVLGPVPASELTMEGTEARAVRESSILPSDLLPRPHLLSAHKDAEGKWVEATGSHSYHLDPIRVFDVAIPIREVESSAPAGFRFEWGEGELSDGTPVRATSGAGAGNTWATIAFGEGESQREFMFNIRDVIDLLHRAVKEGVPA